MLTDRSVGLLLAVVVSATACHAERPGQASSPQGAEAAQAQHVQEVVAAGGVVDSILPIPVQLERFRADLAERPDTLRHASASREALVTRWTRAVAANDTAALNAMVLDQAEFAWLYYPDSRMSLPPYEAPPQLLWGQILESSNAGARALLNTFGGKPLAVGSLRCPTSAIAEGRNLLYERCTVRLRSAGTTLPENVYFGTIVERDHRFKFLGYANNL